MSDTNLIETLLNNKLEQVIEQEISDLVKNKDWISDLESQIVAYAQDRISAKFNNISTVPSIVTTIKTGVKELFDRGQIPSIKDFLDVSVVQVAVDQGVQDLVQHTIDHLLLDNTWLGKIQTIVDRRMADRVQAAISQIDINATIDQSISNNFRSHISKIKQDLTISGIDAADTLVTITNDLVVKKNLTIVGDLVVRGQINTDGPAWQAMVSSAAEHAKEQLITEYKNDIIAEALVTIEQQGINADKILIEDQPVMSGQTLLPAIQNSSLTSVGELKTLTVKGNAHLSNCLHVENRRVGVNTDSPDAALSVWDEEVTVSVGKLRQDTAYIGTNRRQNFAITVNRQSQLEISADGLTTIQKLQIGKHKISHSNEEPGWLGSKGDFVINNDFKDGSPFAWICLGQYKWQALRAAG